MSSLEILTFPNPFLRKVASRVEVFDEALGALVEEMAVVMHAHEGVGLAATQVGRDMQLLLLSSYVFLSPEERARLADDPTWRGEDIAVINPRVVEQSADEITDTEGCLSFPEVYIKVPRPRWVKIEAQNARGELITLEGEGFGARAILHEMDHLNGKVMTDRLSYLARETALNKHRRVQRALEAKRDKERAREAQGGRALGVRVGGRR